MHPYEGCLYRTAKTQCTLGGFHLKAGGCDLEEDLAAVLQQPRDTLVLRLHETASGRGKSRESCISAEQSGHLVLRGFILKWKTAFNHSK